MTRLTRFPPPQVLFYLLFYIFFSMRYYVNQRRDWATPQTPPSPHLTPHLYRYYINQRRATFYADTFESETKSMKHARLLFTS